MKLANRSWTIPYCRTNTVLRDRQRRTKWTYFTPLLYVKTPSHQMLHYNCSTVTRGSASLPVVWGMYTGHGIGISPVLYFGSEVQKQRFLPAASEAKERWCLGITELEAGSDVAGIRTTAILSSDKRHYIVSGCCPSSYLGLCFA